MDLINPSPSLPLPKTMWLVLRAKALADDLSLVAPDELQAPSASGHVKAAERALNELGILGLPTERLQIARGSYSGFADALRSAVLGEAQGDPSTLRAAIEWLMKQSPTRAISSANFESLDPDRVFQGPARWNGFTFWAPELGFAEYAWAVGQTEDALVANPMRAIGSVIKRLREPGPRPDAMPVRQFLDRLQAALPVFPTDGADTGIDPLGQAVSWALIGAHAKAWLNLEMKADASRVYLTDPDAPDSRRAVSHVTLGVGNGE
jgi:hypothetical protein